MCYENDCGRSNFYGHYETRHEGKQTPRTPLQYTMTVLDDFLRNIVMRRPALQRWSVANDMLPVVHDFITLHHTKYKQWCEKELPKVRAQLAEASKYFRTPLEAELDTILSSIDQLFLLVGDYLYDILISGKPAVQWLLNDERIADVLNAPLFGKAIDYWLRVPLMQLVAHVVDQTVLIQTHKKLTNTFQRGVCTQVRRTTIVNVSQSTDDTAGKLRDAVTIPLEPKRVIRARVFVGTKRIVNRHRFWVVATAIKH